jgi:hypothetical protein
LDENFEVKEMNIVQYTNIQAAEWDAFVRESKNGTFLLERSFMDYHSDRFQDCSLMIYEDNLLIGLFPANWEEKGHIVWSHQGLTYGGLVMSAHSTTVHLMEIVRKMNEGLREEGIRRVVYKAVPWIYHLVPAEEDLYAIHHECRYTLLERDISSAVMLQRPLGWKKDRRHGLKKATESGIAVGQSADYATFWNILTHNLETCHGVSPVHSLNEILLLQQRFPHNIMLFAGHKDGEMLGGCVVYVTPQVVHAQYISATPEGKRLGVVDAIIHHLFFEAFPQFTYFDFGKSTEQHSDTLNENLIYQKEGFGARGVCYDTYTWEL